MKVVFARHGNTFEAGERPVWVGARTDLPLTAKGREQGSQIGAALQQANLIPARVVAGPLKRTIETAQQALATLGVVGVSVEVDERLREIDYGIWEGKSSEEIQSLGHGKELEGWDVDARWPEGAGWGHSRTHYLQNLLALVEDAARERQDPLLVISSNGLFKIFATSLASRANGKMATGHLSLLNIDGNAPEILLWNLSPSEFVKQLVLVLGAATIE